MSVTVVLLAAGRSSRTSKLKQLYKVNGTYLINHQIEGIRDYGYDVAVVLGYRSEIIAPHLPKDLQVIDNPHYENGMFSSVKAAFKVLNASALIFCHIDRPLAEQSVFEHLLQSRHAIATASYRGTKAPPIMIQSSMKKALLESDATRLDHWIESTQKAEHIEVDDEKVLFNANTDETLRRYFG